MLAAPRSYASTPISQGEGTRRGSRERRSRERSRIAEKPIVKTMLQALAEADAAHQLRPDLHRGESDPQILPLLPPELMEIVTRTPITPHQATPDIQVELGHIHNTTRSRSGCHHDMRARRFATGNEPNYLTCRTAETNLQRDMDSLSFGAHRSHFDFRYWRATMPKSLVLLIRTHCA